MVEGGFKFVNDREASRADPKFSRIKNELVSTLCPDLIH